jgi:hypothetical protein
MAALFVCLFVCLLFVVVVVVVVVVGYRWGCHACILEEDATSYIQP